MKKELDPEIPDRRKRTVRSITRDGYVKTHTTLLEVGVGVHHLEKGTPAGLVEE